MTANGEQRLPEEIARQVLARAAELDAKDHMSVSLPDLRSAAVEAGISAGALNQALSEIAFAQPAPAEHAPAEPARRDLRSRRRLLAIVAAVTVVGAVAGWAFLRVAPREIPEAIPIETPPLPPPPPPPPGR